MKKTATWKTTTGVNVTVTAELTLKKTINADGHKVTITCCEKDIDVTVEGHGSQGGWINTKSTPVESNGLTIVAQVGKLGLTQEQVEIIQGLEKEIESHPAWIAKQTKIKKNQEEIAAMEAKRAASGYCSKCGSYCYGDCQA